MTVLGPGAVCCGDPEGCLVQCAEKPLLYDVDDVAEEFDVDLTDEEEDDE